MNQGLNNIKDFMNQAAKLQKELQKDVMKQFGGDQAQKDPELAELMKAQKGFDLNAMMNQLNEDISDEAAEAELHQIELDEINSNIASFKANAKKLGTQGKKQEAIKFVQLFKKQSARLAKFYQDHPSMNPNPPPAPEIPCQGGKGMQQQDLEQKYHANDDISCLSALQYEIETMQKKIQHLKKAKKDAEFFVMKKDLLMEKKQQLQVSANDGLLSPQRYQADVKKSLQIQKKKLIAMKKIFKPGDENIVRVETRIKKIEDELQDQGEEEQQQEDEQSKKQQQQKKQQPLLDFDQRPLMRKSTIKSNVINQMRAEGARISLKRSETPRMLEEIDQSNIDFSKINNKKYNELKIMVNDNKVAAQYFITIGEKRKAEQYIIRAEKIKPYIQKIAQGKDVPTNIMAYKVTQSDFHVIEERQRVKEYSKLLNHLNSQIQKRKEKAEKFLAASKKVKSKPQQANCKMLASRFVKEGQEIKAQKMQVLETQKNPWQPIPIYHFEQDYQNVLKKNQDIKDGCCEFTISVDKNSSKLKDHSIAFQFPFSSEEKKEFVMKLGKSKSEQVFLVQGMRGSGYKNLASKKMSMMIVKSGWFGKKKVVYQTDVPIRGLQKDIEATEVVKYQQIAGTGCCSINISSEIKITFKVPKGLKDPIYDRVKTQKLVIDKILPPFDSSLLGKMPQQSEKQSHSRPSGRVLPSDVKEAASSKQQQKSQRTEQYKQLKTPAIKIQDGKVPQGIFPQQLKDPDFVETMASLTYLEYLNESLIGQVKKLSEQGKRVSNELKKKLMTVGQRKMIITAQVQSQQMTQQAFGKILQLELEHCQVLLAYFKHIGDKDKFLRVGHRIKLVSQDIKSLSED